MKAPPAPENEYDRLQALHACFLLDTGKEEGFDRLTRLAQRYFNTKIALVSLVDSDRQWFKSKQGLDATETSREISFCGHAILSEELLVVEDAVKDTRFADNPLVEGPPHIRFYAGAPLHSPDGHSIGTLCIIDDHARTFTESDRLTLRDFADSLETEINLRLSKRHQQALATLTTIAALGEGDLREQMRNALRLGCATLGLEFGIISKINQGNDVYEVLVQNSPPDTLSDHQQFPFSHTFCHLTLKQGTLLDISHMGESSYSGHPCYADFGLESYIGVPLYVDGKIYGTLNFSSPNPRSARSFFDEDINFVHLLGSWVSKNIKRWQLDTELTLHHRLNDAITNAQTQFIAGSERQKGFKALLSDTLSLTESEYGFIGEVLYDLDDSPYLKTYAITNIAWDDASRNFYDNNAPQGMEFSNLDTLFGAVLRSGQAVIANTPSSDRRSGGLPEGHPPLNAFLGLPIYHDGKLLAMVGLANRPQGYDQALTHFLSPLLATIGQLVEAARNDTQRKATERRLTDILDATQLATWEWNPKTAEAHVNEQWAQIVGYTMEELQPINYETWVSFIHPDDLAIADQQLNQHLAGQLPAFDVEYRMRHKDGRWIWVHDHGRVISWDKDGAPLFMSGMRQDINQQRLAELHVKEHAAHTQAILDNMADGLISYDESGIIQSLNTAAEHIFGYTSAEAKGQDICLLLANGEQERSSRKMMGEPASPCSDQKRRFEIEGLRKSRQEFSMEVAVSTLIEQGSPLYVAVLQDISERKRIERMKSEFVSTVSHELRTPLTSISGAIGLVVKNAQQELNPKAAKMIDIAYKNCHRLTHLINDLLDMEKLEAGKLQLNMMPQLLMPLVEQAVEANAPGGATRGIQLNIKQSIPEAEVMVDSDRFVQVITNLLSNAIKFSPAEAAIEINADINEGAVVVSVQDCGPGISPEFSTQVFQKFAQADSSDTRDKGGTGLGLAISQELTERMGGEIGFDPNIDTGAYFYVKFPLLNASQPAEGNTLRPRILVVEDEADISELLAIMLTRCGYDVDQAHTGQQALDALANNAYAAMTLDLALPDISGLEIIRLTREQANTAHLPIIVLSAKMEAGRLEINGDFSDIDWLAKPLNEELLLNRLEKQIHPRVLKPMQVLHIEDDTNLQDVIRGMAGDNFQFTAATTLSEACDAIEAQTFDTIILDLALPDGSGWDLLPLIKKKQQQARVVLLTAKEPSLEQMRSVEASLLKTRTSARELIHALGNRVAASPPKT